MMKRILLLTFLLISVSAVCLSQRLVEVAKGYSCTSVNTAVFRNKRGSSILATTMPKGIWYLANGS